MIPKEVRKRHGLRRNVDLVLLESGGAIVLRKKEDVEEILKDEFTPLLPAAEGSMRELWDNSEDDAWNDV